MARPALCRGRSPRTKRGTVALEFAFVAPVLLILLVGIVEIGNGVYEAMQVQNAAEAGALYVAKHGWNSAAISAAVTNATGLSGVTASPAPSQFCGCPSAGAVTVVICTGTCVGGTAVSSYVRINAAFAHTAILSYPGIAAPATLTGTAIVRVN
jgi:Flp pilus assembly protein TadG